MPNLLDTVREAETRYMKTGEPTPASGDTITRYRRRQWERLNTDIEATRRSQELANGRRIKQHWGV